MFEVLQYDYAIRALIAASVVGITCGMLGCFVILRKMALIGDALSHAILPGVVVGFVLFGHNPLAIFAGAVLAGLITAAIITWIQRNSITKDDASIGIVFTAMFALGIIGISWLTKKQGVHLDMKDFLFGNVLGVSDADLWLTGLIGAYVALSIFLFFKYFFITTFDPLIALTIGISVAVVHYFLMFLLSLTIVASLQSVGVILVVAMLIIPASTAYLLTDKLKRMVILSGILGFFSATLGFLFAVAFETTPGPAMTLVSASFFGVTILFSPKRGVFIKFIRKLRKSYTADQQDILKTIHKLSQRGEISADNLKKETGFIKDKIISLHLYHLQYHKHIKLNKNQVFITESGTHEAEVLVRAHRVWESYLVNELNVPMDKIHESAEALEHVLPKEFIDKIEKDLGYPVNDPHGSPIPKIKYKNVRLASLKVGQIGVISEKQSDGLKELWRLGIFPNTNFVVKQTGVEFVSIQQNNSTFEIELTEAEKINVKI